MYILLFLSLIMHTVKNNYGARVCDFFKTRCRVDLKNKIQHENQCCMTLINFDLSEIKI